MGHSAPVLCYTERQRPIPCREGLFSARNRPSRKRPMATDNLSYFDQILARKEAQALRDQLLHVPDSLEAWMAWYLRMTILGVREQPIAKKIALHLERFRQFLVDHDGHERISSVLKRDV